MKVWHRLLPFLVFICCLSCKHEETSFAPFIQVSYFYLNPQYDGDEIVGAEDTLSIRYCEGKYVIDSIDMNDRVVFAAAFGSIGNELVTVRCTFDTLRLDMQAALSEEVQRILLPASDVRQLQLFVNPGYNYVAVPISYQPLQDDSLQFELKVESDSECSPVSYTFIQPIR